MGYYIRVLGTQDPDIHIHEILESLKADGLSAKIEFDQAELPNKWTFLRIVDNKGEVLSQIEKNIIVDGELGQEELDEFRESIQDFKPASAVSWLTAFFEKVKVIYAFQLLTAAFKDNNLDIIGSVKTKIWNKTNGILQADNEGFSNQDGFHILWQFSDSVTGKWSCSVLSQSGEWQNFIMDSGDKTQRKEFQDGNIPKKAKCL